MAKSNGQLSQSSLFGHQEIGKLKRQTLAVSAHYDKEKLAKSYGKLSQPPLIWTTRNWHGQTANSRSLCSLGHREIGKVKRQTLTVTAHWDMEKKGKSNCKLSQSLLIRTPRNWQSQTANSRSLHSFGHQEICKVKQQTLAVSAHWDTEKLANSNGKLSQSLPIGTWRNWERQTVISRSFR